MVNSILDAVTTQLGTTFGLDYRYYVEDVEQHLTKPCFTVDTLLPVQRSKSPLLYDRVIPMVIHYFSDKPVVLKKDCYAMAERIVECLEYLPFKETTLRGENISWQITEDVLEVFITYRFTTRKDIQYEDAMDTLEDAKVSAY